MYFGSLVVALFMPTVIQKTRATDNYKSKWNIGKAGIVIFSSTANLCGNGDHTSFIDQ